MGKPKELHRFYKSKAWLVARNLKTNATLGKCERCGAIGEEVHHKIRLTTENVVDSNISINQENLELLCKDCHNDEHERFKKKEVIFDKYGNFIE
jgi:5-methylcytosine-specific restriction endonuclease McrA